MSEKRPTIELSNGRLVALGALAMGTVMAGAQMLGLMNDKNPKPTPGKKQEISTLSKKVNTLPRDQHVIGVVAKPGDTVWSIVDDVAHAEGLNNIDLRPAVLEANAPPEIHDGLSVGEVVNVDLDLLK